MSDSERSLFLPVVTLFTNVLEKGNASPNESSQLLQYAKDLSELIPGGLGAGLGDLTGGAYYRPGYASYGFGERQPYQPQSLQTFRYGQNPIRNQAFAPTRSAAAPLNTVNTGSGKYFVSILK